MKENQKVAYSGYIVQENCDLRDDDVIEYEFRNAGESIVELNGIFLLPKTSAGNAPNFPFNWFKETITENQKNGRRYRVKFIKKNEQEVNNLIVIEKRLVFN